MALTSFGGFHNIPGFWRNYWKHASSPRDCDPLGESVKGSGAVQRNNHLLVQICGMTLE